MAPLTCRLSPPTSRPAPRARYAGKETYEAGDLSKEIGIRAKSKALECTLTSSVPERQWWVKGKGGCQVVEAGVKWWVKGAPGVNCQAGINHGGAQVRLPWTLKSMACACISQKYQQTVW